MKKIGLLCLALVLALGTMGVGYALWYEDLYINGTVETGNLDAIWTACYCFDNGLDPNPDGSDKGKDVGSTICQIDGSDPHILHITVTNGYPCYWNDCEVELTNVGSIPLIIESIAILNPNFTPATAYGADDGPVWIGWVNGVGTQLAPYPSPDPFNHPDSSGSSFKIHVEQCAAQGAVYTFSLKVKVVQYNESVHFKG